MTDLAGYVEAAKQSTYFSGARLADDLAGFSTSAPATRRSSAPGSVSRRLYLVGGGGSLATLMTAKLIFDRLTDVPTEALSGYDLVWRDPPASARQATAVFASYSGRRRTRSRPFGPRQERGARTVALVNTLDCTLGREADLAIPWESAAIFEAPLAALTLAAASRGRPAGRGGVRREAIAARRPGRDRGGGGGRGRAGGGARAALS